MRGPVHDVVPQVFVDNRGARDGMPSTKPHELIDDRANVRLPRPLAGFVGARRFAINLRERALLEFFVAVRADKSFQPMLDALSPNGDPVKLLRGKCFAALFHSQSGQGETSGLRQCVICWHRTRLSHTGHR